MALADIPEYKVWQGMRDRCLNSGADCYPRYGGRGIRICERWDSFQNFYADMGPRPSSTHSIERKDNTGNYCPENCCWATKKDQGRNKRSNRNITYQGKTQCIAAWAEEFGVNPAMIWFRLSRGWTPEKAISTPPIHVNDRHSCRIRFGT